MTHNTHSGLRVGTSKHKRLVPLDFLLGDDFESHVNGTRDAALRRGSPCRVKDFAKCAFT